MKPKRLAMYHVRVTNEAHQLAKKIAKATGQNMADATTNAIIKYWKENYESKECC